MKFLNLIQRKIFFKPFLCSVIFFALALLNNIFGQEAQLSNELQKKGFSIAFGFHFNGYFQSISQDTCITGTGTCMNLSSMGIKRISPVTGLDLGINYNFFISNKLSIIPKLSYSNRKIKFEVDSLTLIETPNNYPLKYREVLKYNISPNCLDLGLFFEYKFFKNKFSIAGGVKYTFITFLQKKLMHFSQVESSEKRIHFFNNQIQRLDFPPRSISTFHPSVLIAFHCNDKYGKTIVKPFLGVEMENTHFYYFQFGIEVPIGKVSNSFK